MKISQTGIDLIKSFEGLKLNAYKCSAGVATIGFGSTFYPDFKPVKMGDKLKNIQEAEELLKLTLIEFEKNVSALFYNVILKQNQFDALVSFAFNLGTGALAGSTLFRKIKINANDQTIALEFAKWVNAGGKKLPGLIRRRKAESDLYFMQ
jgi:lysozyme